MMKLPSVKDLKIENKKVLLRTDYDVPLRLGRNFDLAQGKPSQLGNTRLRQVLKVSDTTRIKESLPTINYLLKQKVSQIIIISHLGRPEGKVVPELSLKPISERLSQLLGFGLPFLNSADQLSGCPTAKLVLLDNLRFDPREEQNDVNFAKNLASLADFYVNDAFAASHRAHVSIVGLPKFFPANRRAFGLSFLKEIEILSKIRKNPQRPVTVILGGAKKDKLDLVEKLSQWADWVLIGGLLPKYVENWKLKIENSVVANLNEEGKDISAKSIQIFTDIIKQSKTVVWAGPMGVYEEEKFAAGTREIATAIVKSKSFGLVGGGDTEAALTKLGFDDKINYVSSGGGAMLEYLATGTLAGIEAIVKSLKKLI